jgi:hypothetical protein
VRVLVGLAVVLVFGAMFIFDTTALLRLTWSCATGGCGVNPVWIVITAGGLACAAWLASRRDRRGGKVTVAAGKGPPRKSRGKATAKRKPKPTK